MRVLRLVLKNLIMIFALMSISLAKDDRSSEKNNYSRYHLHVGNFEGTFSDKTPPEFLLYDKPSSKAKLAFKLKPKEFKDPSKFLRQFDDKKAVWFHQGISCTEEKNDFYKVFYKGKYYWAPKSNFYRIEPIEKYMKRQLFMLKREAKILDKPGGKPVGEITKRHVDAVGDDEGIEEKLLKEEDISFDHSLDQEQYLRVGVKEEKVSAEILDHKYVDGILWLKVRIGRFNVCESYTPQEGVEIITGWTRPYDSNGSPLWSYYDSC